MRTFWRKFLYAWENGLYWLQQPLLLGFGMPPPPWPDRMAYWAECNWRVTTKADLDCYTFSVAGAGRVAAVGSVGLVRQHQHQ